MDGHESVAVRALAAFARDNGLDCGAGLVPIVTPKGPMVLAWKWTHANGISYSARTPGGRMKVTGDHATPEAAALVAGWRPAAEAQVAAPTLPPELVVAVRAYRASNATWAALIERCVGMGRNAAGDGLLAALKTLVDASAKLIASALAAVPEDAADDGKEDEQ